MHNICFRVRDRGFTIICANKIMTFCCSVLSCHATSTHMMTSWNGNIFCITGSLWGESWTGDQWIPLAKACDGWRFLWSSPEQTAEQTIKTPVIWEAIALIMTSLSWFRRILRWKHILWWKAYHKSYPTTKSCEISFSDGCPSLVTIGEMINVLLSRYLVVILFSEVLTICRRSIAIPTMKWKCHFDETFITGSTKSCHFDNFRYNQWWKFRQNYNISASVKEMFVHVYMLV